MASAMFPLVLHAVGLCEAALRGGGKLFFCGNGGSAADAQHLATELLVRLRSRVERP
ncbi:MAG: SIS domain-containing protein, partial [bacterium]